MKVVGILLSCWGIPTGNFGVILWIQLPKGSLDPQFARVSTSARKRPVFQAAAVGGGDGGAEHPSDSVSFWNKRSSHGNHLHCKQPFPSLPCSKTKYQKPNLLHVVPPTCRSCCFERPKEMRWSKATAVRAFFRRSDDSRHRGSSEAAPGAPGETGRLWMVGKAQVWPQRKEVFRCFGSVARDTWKAADEMIARGAI